MKKSLLLASALVMGASSAFAGVDPDSASYAVTNGIDVDCMWLHSRVNGSWDVGNKATLPFLDNYGKVRTATIWNDGTANKVVMGYSKPVNYTKEDGTEEAIDTATLLIYNIVNGALENEVQLSYNGEPIKGLLSANQIGTDDAGNLWIAGYIATITTEAAYKVYVVKDVATGECDLAAELYLPEDDMSASGRIDYCDILGDVTGATSHGIVMAPIASGSDLFVLRWKREQGATEWVGDFDGFVSLAMGESYPSGQTTWNTAPSIAILYDEELTGENFYVDGNSTCPSLYNTTGSMIESFATATDMAPAVGCNGVAEFELASKNFIVYVLQQYNAEPGCCIRVAELGEGMVFEGMTGYWDLPKAGLGTLSDGGTRIHGIMTTEKMTDAAGKTARYLLTYKCNNGIGVYRIQEEGFVGEAGVEGIIADQDANTPAVYYNLQGVQVQNPENGVYVVKRGNTVTKEVIVK